MLTTSDPFAFMNALDPGDVLAFRGTDPIDRLLQWVDGSSCNHVGVWIGDLRDEKNADAVEYNQTIHAGLSSRSLPSVVREELFDPRTGPARRHGTVWLIPLDELLSVRDGIGDWEDQISASIDFEEITAVRWRDSSTLDPNALLRTMVSRLDPSTVAPVFDVEQMVELSEFWIRRAYVTENEDELMPDLALRLFRAMEPTLAAQTQAIRDLRAKAAARYEAETGQKLPEPEATTCARFIFDAFDAVGSTIDIPLRARFGTDAPGDTRNWVTPNDLLCSPSFRVIARYTRRPRTKGS